MEGHDGPSLPKRVSLRLLRRAAARAVSIPILIVLAGPLVARLRDRTFLRLLRSLMLLALTSAFLGVLPRLMITHSQHLRFHLQGVAMHGVASRLRSRPESVKHSQWHRCPQSTEFHVGAVRLIRPGCWCDLGDLPARASGLPCSVATVWGSLVGGRLPLEAPCKDVH
jgi:hypothetical protein